MDSAAWRECEFKEAAMMFLFGPHSGPNPDGMASNDITALTVAIVIVIAVTIFALFDMRKR